MKSTFPSQVNNYFSQHANLILSSFFNLTGNHLINPANDLFERSRELFEAPFCVVSHNTHVDPIFNYGNKSALAVFEMSWDRFIKLPSRLSAEDPIREEREKLLAQVTKKGYIDNYQGIRISASGRRFLIKNAIIWNLFDGDKNYNGQAAVLYEWSYL